MQKNAVVLSLGFLGITFLLSLTGCGGGSPDNGINQGTITGRVVRADDPTQGVSGATVSVNDGRATVVTNSNGEFQIISLVGRHTLTITPPSSYEGFSEQVTVNSSGSHNLGELPVLPSGVTLENISINAPLPDGPDGSYLLGKSYGFNTTVTRSNGQVLSGWKVRWRVEGGVATIDSSGRLLTTSEGVGRVVAFVKWGTNVLESQPVDIKVAQEAGQPSFLVYATFSKSIREYSGRTGNVQRTFGGGTLDSATRTALATGNQMYVCDTTNNRVWRVDISSGVVQAITSLPENPYDVLVEPDGSLLVLTKTRLYRVDPTSGSYQLIFNSGSSAYSLIDMEKGPDGKIYIANATGSLGVYATSVIRLDVNNPQPEVIIRGRAGQTGHIGRPVALTFVPNYLTGGGELLVADDITDAIYRFTSNGDLLGTAFAFKGPVCLRFGPDEKLYVSGDTGSSSTRGVRRYNYPSFNLVEDVFINISRPPNDFVFAEDR
jgi:hypothetical protein